MVVLLRKRDPCFAFRRQVPPLRVWLQLPTTALAWLELPRVLERAAKGPAAAQGVGSASATTESATAIAAEHAAAALRAAATTATIAAAGSIRRQRRTDTKAKGAWREYTTATRAATEEGFSEEAVEIATAVAAVEEGAR